MNLLKINIKEIKEKYPNSGYPMLEYCKYLVKKGTLPGTRLEAWNYERPIPEWDWAVPDVVEYAKMRLPREKIQEWHRG